MTTKKSTPKTRKALLAMQPFWDVVTQQQYNPGDEVTGWDEKRMEHYAELRMVKFVEVEDTEEE